MISLYCIDEQYFDFPHASTDIKRTAVGAVDPKPGVCGFSVSCRSPFRQDQQYSRSINVPLRRPSSDTADILDAALAGLRAIYQTGFNYARAGVMLMDLQSDQVQQGELDWEEDGHKDRGRLMASLDDLNQRFGRGTVTMASSGLAGDKRIWSMKQQRRTPAYTTCIDDMPTAKA